MRKVYLIRHGTTVANEHNLYYGATDISVSPKGCEELTELRKNGGYPDIKNCAVYTSGMKRTAETLELLFPGTEYSVHSGFREMNFGKFEMRSYDELKGDPEYIEWITGDFMANVCPEGESGNAQAERALKAFWEVFGSNEKDVMIVSHSGTITAVMESIFPNIAENRWYWRCYGGHGYEIDFENNTPMAFREIPVN